MNRRERALARKNPAALVREAAYQDEQRRKAKARTRSRPRRAPGVTREQRREEADALELAGKATARLRAQVEGAGPFCEWFVNGQRCGCYGSDCDHVLGGRWKKKMEALPNGEGFMVLCRTHHQIEKHNGSKMASLLQAEEHAIRIGSKGLLRHVNAAIARFNAKHPGVPVHVEEKTP